MKISISGSGTVAAGKYEDIRISGSARLQGDVTCRSLRVSGACEGDALQAGGDLKISGSARFGGRVEIARLAVSGSLRCAHLEASQNLWSAGSVAAGSLCCGQMTASGSVQVQENMEVGRAYISGRVYCGGVLSADDLTVAINGDSHIARIRGGRVLIGGEQRRSFLRVRAPIEGSVKLDDTIEADSISLEHVQALQVSGRIVKIGEGCEIDLVRYSDHLEVSPLAKVNRSEKIEKE